MCSDNIKMLSQIRVVASCGEGLIDTVMGLLTSDAMLGAVFCLYNNSTASGTIC